MGKCAFEDASTAGADDLSADTALCPNSMITKSCPDDTGVIVPLTACC